MELHANLANAKQAYGPLEVSVRVFGDSGYADIMGKAQDGSKLLLVPPFSFFETSADLGGCVASACQAVGLSYSGVVSPRSVQTTALH